MNQSTEAKCNAGFTIYTTNASLFEMRPKKGSLNLTVNFKSNYEKIGPWDFEEVTHHPPEWFLIYLLKINV